MPTEHTERQLKTRRGPNKIAVLDVYPVRNYRVEKDTNGGFGTANQMGTGAIANLLGRLVKRFYGQWPALHTAYAMGALRAQGYEVHYTRSVQEAQQSDLVILPSSIVAHETELDTVRSLSAAKKPMLVIGPFASVMSQPYLERGAKVLSGEPEQFFHRWGIPESLFDGKAEVIPNNVQQPLDELPYPAWDTLPKPFLPAYGLLSPLRQRMIPMIATRGCPYSCFHYCVYPMQQGRAVRRRDPQKIAEEMVYWSDHLGLNRFVFRDPVFSIHRGHTMALCDALEATGRKFRFLVETHLRNMDEELLLRLKKVGLEWVKVGVESVSPEVLKGIHRYTVSVDEQREKIRMISAHGVNVQAMYILGSPPDTQETCAATIDYALELGSTTAQFNIFTPYPGTPVYREFAGKIIAKEMQEFTQNRLVFRHEQMSGEQIDDFVARANRKFYLRPSFVRNFLRLTVHDAFAPSPAKMALPLSA